MLLQSIPYPSGAVAGYFTLEALADNSVAAAATETLLTDTRSPAAGDYIGFWSVDISGGVYSTAIMKIDGATIDSQQCAVNDAGDVFGFAGMFFYTADGLPHTFSLDGQNDGGSTTHFANARISLIPLGADDETAVSLGNFNRTATSLATAASLTFTPPTNGNYLLVCTFHAIQIGAGQPRVQLSDGTTTIDYKLFDCRSATGNPGYLWMIPIAGVGGVSVTVTLKLAATVSGQQQRLNNMRFLALREDRFAAVHEARNTVDNSGADTSFVVGGTGPVSQTWTPAAADHLTLASIIGSNNDGSTKKSQWQYNDGGVSVSLAQRLPNTDDASEGKMGVLQTHRIAAYPNASRTASAERKSLGGSPATTFIKAGSMIAAIDLTGI